MWCWYFRLLYFLLERLLLTHNIFVFLLRQPTFYSQEEYSKRLLGNSFSIPTVEFILMPIKSFFAERVYPSFNYVYAWERPEVLDRPPPEVSRRVRELIAAEDERIYHAQHNAVTAPAPVGNENTESNNATAAAAIGDNSDEESEPEGFDV